MPDGPKRISLEKLEAVAREKPPAPAAGFPVPGTKPSMALTRTASVPSETNTPAQTGGRADATDGSAPALVTAKSLGRPSPAGTQTATAGNEAAPTAKPTNTGALQQTFDGHPLPPLQVSSQTNSFWK
jgi:hypothetical protein